MSDCSFIWHVLNIHQSGCSAVLVVTRLVPHKTTALSKQVLCTPCNHAPVYTVTIRSRIHMVCVSLAVSCHLHFWQSDRDLLRATVVTQGWNRYQTESAQTVDPRERKNTLAFLLGLEPVVRSSRNSTGQRLFF